MSAAAEGAHQVELRRATVMFADLVGFTAMSERLGPEQAYHAVTRCLKLLDGIARKHGGAVDKYQGDRLLAVFGYPVPLEDAEAAAALAAVEMHQCVRDYNRDFALEMPLALHIGVNTGEMVAGDIRGPVIREFHVLGDAVNTAARLNAKASLGGTYVGPETWERTRDRFEYRVLEPLKLKGKAQRVPVYELVSAHAPEALDRLGGDARIYAPHVGRGRELAGLRERVRRLAAGEGGVLVLLGADGSGKSRLLVELGGAPELAGLGVLQARARSVDQDRPRHLLAGLLRQWAGIAADDDETRARGKLEEAIVRALPEVAPEVLDGAVALLWPSAKRRRRSEELEEWLSLSLVHVLTSASALRPLLVVLEDLQWCDPESLDLLVRVLALTTDRPILYLASLRSEPAEAASTRLARLAEARPGGVDELRLAPLSESESRQLIDVLIGDDDVPPEARALIAARAAGNPGRLVQGVFLAPALRSELDRSREHERSSEAERRRATILFADITGFTAMTEKLGAERAYPIVAGCLARLDAVARKHGGTVDKYLGDCVMALFGVPRAIEDAPRAAVNTAIEMSKAVRAYNRERDLPLPLDVHCGIHTGLGIAGDISGPLIREFAVMGDPVDVADRLKDLAPAGHTYVGSSTHQLTEDVFDYRPVAPLELPGRAEPVPAYELLSRDERLYRRRVGTGRRISSALVGRDAELGRLRDRARRLAEGDGGIVSLIGEAGLGKSRLVAELFAATEAREVTWLEGRSISVGQQLSFHPFADLLRAWADIRDEDREEEIPAKLEAALRELAPDQAEELFPFLASVMGVRLAGRHRERIESVPGEMLDKLLRRSVTEFLRRLSETQPVGVVFDDLHWADLSSIELLGSLLRLSETRPILFVHVFRPKFTATSDRVLERARADHASRHVEIALEPLGADAARLLINNLFRNADIPLRVRTLIADRTGGNPFYVEEVVRSLIEEGAVEEQEDGFRATERIHDVVIPGTVQEVIMARLDHLDLVLRQILQVASVIGRTFHLDVLQQIFPEKDELLAHLERLEDGQFLVPWDRLQGVEYAFKHPLIQEVTYDSLLQAKREELHLRVGEAIETALTENVPGYHAMLAYHFSLARDLERAEDSLFRAGDEAARTAASSEALHFFRQASELYFELHGEGGDPAKKARLEKSIGLALYNRGGHDDEAADHFDRALEYLGQRVPRHAAVLNLRFAADLLVVLARLYLAGRRRPSVTADQLDVMDLMFKRAVTQSTSSPTRFVYDSLAGLRRLSRVDALTVPNSGGWYAGAVGIFSYGGLSFALGQRFLDTARAVVEAGGSRELHLYYRVVGFLHHFLAGHWSDAHEIEPELLEEGLRDGRMWEVNTYLGLLAEKQLRQGAFAAARESLERVDKMWEAYEYENAKVQRLGVGTMLALEERDLPEVGRLVELYYEQTPQELLHLLALGCKAEAQVLGDAMDDARTTLERGAGIVASAGRAAPFHLSSYLVSRFLFDLVALENALSGGGRAARRAAARRARRSGRAAVGIVPKVVYRGPEAFRLRGRLAALLGRRDEAARWWERAFEAARALGARPEQARIHHEVAVGLSRGPACDGRDAAAHREEARHRYQTLGLGFDLARLERGATP